MRRRGRGGGGRQGGRQTSPTDEEESFDHHVRHNGWLVLLCLVEEGGVVGHHDGDVEGGEEDNQVPAGLEHPVVGEDEARLLNAGRFVLRQWRGGVGLQEALLDG